ncbi:hypothetical protein ACFWVP_00505 [Streptomyces sp. NPDC058637]
MCGGSHGTKVRAVRVGGVNHDTALTGERGSALVADSLLEHSGRP